MYTASKSFMAICNIFLQLYTNVNGSDTVLLSHPTTETMDDNVERLNDFGPLVDEVAGFFFPLKFNVKQYFQDHEH